MVDSLDKGSHIAHCSQPLTNGGPPTVWLHSGGGTVPCGRDGSLLDAPRRLAVTTTPIALATNAGRVAAASQAMEAAD